MTTKELRELDATIERLKEYAPHQLDSAYAIEVLKKCAEKAFRPWKHGGGVSTVIGITKSQNEFCVGFNPPNHGKAETLELAICLFAKKLFSK